MLFSSTRRSNLCRMLTNIEIKKHVDRWCTCTFFALVRKLSFMLLVCTIICSSVLVGWFFSSSPFFYPNIIDNYSLLFALSMLMCCYLYIVQYTQCTIYTLHSRLWRKKRERLKNRSEHFIRWVHGQCVNEQIEIRNKLNQVETKLQTKDNFSKSMRERERETSSYASKKRQGFSSLCSHCRLHFL